MSPLTHEGVLSSKLARVVVIGVFVTALEQHYTDKVECM